MIERLQTDPTQIVVAAHRGLKCHYPENTLLAFQKALETDVDMLEFDLRLSKDGVVVVIHDETVDRTTNGTGKVSDFTLAELQQLDAGGWFGKVFEGLKIPTFEELCEVIKPYPDILLNVEVKSSPDAKQVTDQAVTMLKEYGFLPRCVFTCFDAEIIAYMHDVHGLKTQGFMGEVMYHFVPGPEGTYSKMWALAMSMNLLTPERVKQFGEMGLLTWSYCPDDEEQVRYSIDCGATLMTSNNPFPALAVRKQLAANGA